VFLGHEIAFVHHDAGVQTVRFGDHEKAIEHTRMRLGARRREHDQHLIEIGHHDPLTTCAARGATRELAEPLVDVGDEPRAGFPVLPRERDLVADGQLESATSFVLEPATQRC